MANRVPTQTEATAGLGLPPAVAASVVVGTTPVGTATSGVTIAAAPADVVAAATQAGAKTTALPVGVAAATTSAGVVAAATPAGAVATAGDVETSGPGFSIQCK